jgi:multicomponent Na+:H+ antiporter subunit G
MMTLEWLLDICSGALLLGGGFFCVSGAVGILRFPDFYTRMHAAGVTDTLGAGLVLIGLMLQAPDAIVFCKLLLVLLFALITGPTASHALAKAALRGGLEPAPHDGGSKGP